MCDVSRSRKEKRREGREKKKRKIDEGISGMLKESFGFARLSFSLLTKCPYSQMKVLTALVSLSFRPLDSP